MAQKKLVQPGDRFIKVGSRTPPLIVKRLLPHTDLPPHAQLAPERMRGRLVTLSISALLDRNLFRPVEAA